MAQPREESPFRFDLVDVVVLMLALSLIALANGAVRTTPMQIQAADGSTRMTFDRTQGLGWPAPICSRRFGEDRIVWFPAGIVANVVVALLLGAAAVWVRRAIAFDIGRRAERRAPGRS